MIKVVLFIVGIILTIIAIALILAKKATAAAVVTAVFAFLAYVVSLNPSILNQENIEPDVSLNTDSLELMCLDEYDLNVVVFPDDSDVIWESSDAEVITVDNKGHIKAISEGTAIVTASVIYKRTEYLDSCKINVTKPYINMDTDCSLYIGETKYLSVDTNLGGAQVIWASNNSDIASVNEEGKIEGIAKGTAKITATVTNNNEEYSAECVLTVEAPVEESDGQKAAESEITEEDDGEESGSNVVSLSDVAWLQEEKMNKNISSKTMRGEQWTDCIGFGSSNINADGNAYIIAACDQKYTRFTAEIAPQEGFDKSEKITLIIYGGCNDEQIFKEEYQIDCMTDSFEIDLDISNAEELYFVKIGNYNQGRIAGQYINGYSGMGVLMRDAVLYE